MSKIKMAILFALLLLLAACPADEEPVDNDSEVLEARDAKELTLRVTDLPEGATEAGDVFEATPENIDDLHQRGELRDDAYEVLKQNPFSSLATRRFSIGNDGTIQSTVVVFEAVTGAETYFDSQPPGNGRVQDAPELGDESFSEVLDTGPSPEPPDERVINKRTVRTRARVANAVVEVIWTDDPDDVPVETALDLGERAVARLT